MELKKTYAKASMSDRECHVFEEIAAERGRASERIARCRGEIAAIEAELLVENPDVAGMCLALSDWSAELRILKGTAK